MKIFISLCILCLSVIASSAQSELSISDMRSQWIVYKPAASNYALYADTLRQQGYQIYKQIPQLNAYVVRSVQTQTFTQRLLSAPVPREFDHLVQAQQEQNIALASNWDSTVMRLPIAKSMLSFTGSPPRIAIVDSGMCLTSTSFDHLILWDLAQDFVDGDTMPQDNFNHGCAVTDIMARHLMDISNSPFLLPIRALDDDGVGRYSSLAQSIVYAVDQGADYINLSLGGTMPSRLLEDAIIYANQAGVIVVAAVGNQSAPESMFPARYDSVIAVGSLTPTLESSKQNNAGYDVLAPGVDIASISNTGIPQTFSGSSFATPNTVSFLVLNALSDAVQDRSVDWLIFRQLSNCQHDLTADFRINDDDIFWGNRYYTRKLLNIETLQGVAYHYLYQCQLGE